MILASPSMAGRTGSTATGRSARTSRACWQEMGAFSRNRRRTARGRTHLASSPWFYRLFLLCGPGLHQPCHQRGRDAGGHEAGWGSDHGLQLSAHAPWFETRRAATYLEEVRYAVIKRGTRKPPGFWGRFANFAWISVAKRIRDVPEQIVAMLLTRAGRGRGNAMLADGIAVGRHRMGAVPSMNLLLGSARTSRRQL